MAQNRGPTILATMWSTTSIATIFVVARIYTRVKILRSVGLDDYLIAFSMMLGLLFVSLTTASVRAGDGQHADELSRQSFETAAMLNTVGFTPGILSFVVPKLGVVALLCRIFNPIWRWKIFLWSLTGGGGLVICGCIVIIYAQCSPTRAMWTPGVVGNCWSPNVLVNYSIFAGALSASLDLFLAIYPAVILWNLQMAMRRKILLLFSFALGAFAAIVAVVKCTHIPGIGNQSDSTYSTSELVIWTNAESNSIIIAACIPTIIPLIETLFFNRNARSFHYRGEQELWRTKQPSTGRLNKHIPLWRLDTSKMRRPSHGVDDLTSLDGIQRTHEISVFTEIV